MYIPQRRRECECAVYKTYRNFELDLENVINMGKLKMVAADIDGDRVRFDTVGWYER